MQRMIHVRAPCFETIEEIRSSKDAKQASVARCLASDDPPRHSRSKSRIAQVSQPFTWELTVALAAQTSCKEDAATRQTTPFRAAKSSKTPQFVVAFAQAPSWFSPFHLS